MASLTEEKIVYIRNSYPQKSTWELSKELGVAHGNIANAISGKTWKHLANPKEIISNNSAKGIKHHKAKLTEDQVKEIRSKYPMKTKAELAREYKISFPNIRVIVNRKIWVHI
jgi:hypothetical protein